MITPEEIQEFLEGADKEEFIVSVEYDYATDSIYKIKEIPLQGKRIIRDNFVPFCWVGDLKGLNFYQSSKKSITDDKQRNVVYQTDKISNLIYTFPHRINETCFSQSRYSDIVDLNLFTTCARQDLTSEVSDFYNDFFLEVVSETVFDYPHVFVSEKTLKPLLFKTPFIVFGAQGTLEYLKKNGFKTFNNFWNESYDSESDPHLRFLKCCEVIRNTIIKPLEELKSMYQEMIPILEHNRGCLLEYVETVYKPLYNKINL